MTFLVKKVNEHLCCSRIFVLKLKMKNFSGTKCWCFQETTNSSEQTKASELELRHVHL